MVQNKLFNANLSDIIQHFQFVVLDEAHSLCADATFADSSFHVFEFLNYISANYPRIKIILMTGTPEPISDHLNDFKIINKQNECINVLPTEICIVSKDTAIGLIGQMSNQEKTVYYSNSATQMVSGKKSLVARLKEYGFTDDEIGICMSEEHAKELNSTLSGLVEKCKLTKEAIVKKHMLDLDCRILLTTSALKEGVNIENDNIRMAFCESHLLSDIQQFAGRVRKGLKTLYIILDARQHTVNNTELQKNWLDFHYAHFGARNAVNQYLEKHIIDSESTLYMEGDYFDRGLIDISKLWKNEKSLSTFGGSIVPMYIKMIEKSNKYLRFNHLTNQFTVFANRYIEQRRINQKLNDNTWLNELRVFANSNGIEFLEKIVIDGIDLEEITEYCNNKKNVTWIMEEKKTIQMDICRMLMLSMNAKIKTINAALAKNQIPYLLESKKTNKDGKSVRGIRITEGKVRRDEAKEKNISDSAVNPQKQTLTKMADKERECLQMLINYIEEELMSCEITSSMFKDLQSLKTEKYNYEVILRTFYDCKEKIVRATWEHSFDSSYHKFKYFLAIVKNELPNGLIRYNQIKQAEEIMQQSIKENLNTEKYVHNFVPTERKKLSPELEELW